MVLERGSRHCRAGQLAAALLALAAAREARSQPIPSSRPRPPETIPLFPRPTTASRDVLESPLVKRDAELGLGASGRIVATVHRLALGQAPRDGRGIVRVFVDENGQVSRVTSTSTSWEGAARAIGEALGGRQFALPRGARTMTLWFDVVARSTQIPAILTGEEARAPTSWPLAVQGRSPSDAPAPVVLVPVESLLPVPRHLVHVTLLHVELR
jgi:hypothetical protein